MAQPSRIQRKKREETFAHDQKTILSHELREDLPVEGQLELHPCVRERGREGGREREREGREREKEGEFQFSPLSLSFSGSVHCCRESGQQGLA